ncbi:MAG TPA: FHA domain-containing protein [Solirubrobacteraceae bacterium]|jgi:pSer/pThr/pTyr-binding forkhead associated (FHA) protein|nr:FHA domain-containing protein [Solirubrobacteraceae bacterium]
MAVHCPECSFVNADGANYCQKCGAYLGGSAEPERDATTATYRIGETGEIEPIEMEDVVASGAGLVIRAGGGRVGETFRLEGDRLAIGRRPESDIFLDDVTVSRDHAVLVRRGADYWLDDCGSLNGTYVNRQRVESHRLQDGDELQIGKYKLSYLLR